jgi:endonuclease IV
MIHSLGSTCGEISRDECMKLIADGINMALDKTSFVTVLLENMSKQVSFNTDVHRSTIDMREMSNASLFVCFYC